MGRWSVMPTTCINGHEYTPENTYIRADGSRSCRTCHAAASRAYKARERAKKWPKATSPRTIPSEMGDVYPRDQRVS